MGKTHEMSMAMFNSELLDSVRLTLPDGLYSIKSYETSIFLWFSYGYWLLTTYALQHETSPIPISRPKRPRKHMALSIPKSRLDARNPGDA